MSRKQINLICLLGGSFDPIHRGHLKIALRIYHLLQPTQLMLMPCANPKHRAPLQATPQQRLDMIQLAIQRYTQLTLCQDELQRCQDQSSYTYDTLCHMRARFPKPISIAFIMGSDSLLSLEQWERWEALLTLSHLIIIPRPGYELHHFKHQPWLQKHSCTNPGLLREKPCGTICQLKHTTINIAARDIRQRIQQYQPFLHLIPYKVGHYILTHRLYALK